MPLGGNLKLLPVFLTFKRRALPGRTMERAENGGSAQVFLPSQLAEISERFRPEVEDLQVFLQEEGLPVGSVECVQELSTRLGSDPRFRRDVAFLVRSMLGRERDEPGADEPGSMDVLGLLVVAAAGTRQEFETSNQQQVIRNLLRFVIQQRRPAAIPAVAVVDRRVATAPPISPPVATRRERRSPVSSAVAPNSVEVPLFFRADEESSSRRAHTGWVVVVLAVLVVVGAGLMIWNDGSKTRTRNAVSLATAPAPALPAYPTPSAPERRVIVPTTSRSSHQVRKPSASTHASRRRAEPAQPSLPQTVAANTPPLAANRLPMMMKRPEPLEPGPKLNQPVSSGAVQPLIPHHDSAALSLPTDVRQRGTPGSIDVSKVFAHPEAAAIAAASQVPPPAFHPSDPVLIRRNKPAAVPEEPEPQGSVHTGSSGNMASSLMYSPDPEYPAQAIAAGVQGEVTVRAVVGPHGNVIDANVVSGPPLLREAALDAVGRWRFRPYEQDGKPVAIATTAIFDFQIPSTK